MEEDYGIYDPEAYLDSVPESVHEYLTPEEIEEGSLETSRLIDILCGMFSDRIQEVLRTIPGLMLIIIIGTVCSEFTALPSDPGMRNTAAMVVNLITFLYILGMVTELYLNISLKVDELYEYGLTLSGVMSSFLLFGGNYTSVSVIMSFMVVVCALLSFISQYVFPAVCAMMIVSSVSSISSSDTRAGNASNMISGLYFTISTAVLSLLSLIVGFQNKVAASADSVVLKSAKIASAYAIPVVGGVISESVDNISSGFGLLKNSFGLGAVTVIILSHHFCFGVQAFICPDRRILRDCRNTGHRENSFRH